MDNPFSRFLKDTYETTKGRITDITDGIRESLQMSDPNGKAPSDDKTEEPDVRKR